MKIIGYLITAAVVLGLLLIQEKGGINATVLVKDCISTAIIVAIVAGAENLHNRRAQKQNEKKDR